MDPIKSCNSYAARPAGVATYRDGKHCFKIYYVDIYDRSQPKRYEWDRFELPREALPEALAEAGVEGIGFVVAFPHITKVFRFAPGAETVLHVRAWRTGGFSEIDLNRAEGYMEFACYAEALIAADEYRFWAEAPSVESYLGRWSKWPDATVEDHGKLGRYYAG